MKTTVKSILNQLKRPLTSAVGSLPHHNIDAALEFSLKFGIPFLPQIPIRNPWEYMIAQALEGLPGIEPDPEGFVTLNYEIWNDQEHFLSARLKKFFSENDPFLRSSFEPSPSVSSCWQPFLWELQERDLKVAKVQIAGPMTAQWALRMKKGSDPKPESDPRLSTQIFQLVLARSMAMVQKIRSLGIQPIVFFDEPALYTFSAKNPKHVMNLQELKIMVQALQREEAWVGLHCCSNTDWSAILGLGVDFLSIDTQLSLASAVNCQDGLPMKNFLANGGTLSLGIIPTARSGVLQRMESEELVSELHTLFKSAWGSQPDEIRKVLSESLYTPACGLALQSPADCELILEKLFEVSDLVTH